MRVTGIQPKDICIDFELGIEEADALSLALSKSKIICVTDEDKECSETLGSFFEMINDVVKDIKGE